MRAIHLVLITSVSLLFCTSADAQRKRGGGGPAAIFKKLDKDANGKISKAEAKGSRLEKRFDKLDKDNDGNITKKEISGARGGKRGKGKRKGKGEVEGNGKRGKGKRKDKGEVEGKGKRGKRKDKGEVEGKGKVETGEGK